MRVLGPKKVGLLVHKEQQLLILLANKIDIGDTAYGREVALQERALEAAAEKMSGEKRDKLRQKLDQINADKTLASLGSTDP
jgi:hypothetical protein